jgi:hypothetical protein
MKLLFSSPNGLLPHHLKGLLDGAGIRSVVQNQHSRIALGGLGYTDCWTELWLVDEERVREARALIGQGLPAGAEAALWRCPACAESVAEPFSECWNCGASRPRA